MVLRRLSQNHASTRPLRFGTLSNVSKLRMEFVTLGEQGQFEKLMELSSRLYHEKGDPMADEDPDYELLIGQVDQYLFQFAEGSLEFQFKLLKFWQDLVGSDKTPGSKPSPQRVDDEYRQMDTAAYGYVPSSHFQPSHPPCATSKEDLRKGKRLQRLHPLFKQLADTCFSKLSDLTEVKQVKQLLELAQNATNPVEPEYEKLLIQKLMGLTLHESGNPAIQKAFLAAYQLYPNREHLSLPNTGKSL